MITVEKTIEGFAQLFYHYQAALAPDFGLGQHSRPDWNELTSSERKLCIAATRLAILDLGSQSVPENDRNIFGELSNGPNEGREWGC